MNEKKLINIKENQNIKKYLTNDKFNHFKSLSYIQLNINKILIVTIIKSGIAGPEISAIGKM